MATLSQLLHSATASLYTGWYVRTGGRFNAWPASTISSIDLLLFRYGSPTGTAYVRVRKVSDDSILGTLGSINVATLSGSATWYTFNATPVVIPTGQDIRIQIEWSGGNSSNVVSTRYYGGNVYANGVFTQYAAVYSDRSTFEFTWRNLTYEELADACWGLHQGAKAEMLS